MFDRLRALGESVLNLRGRNEVAKETEGQIIKSLGDRLAEDGQPFPWGLLSEVKKEAVYRQISGTASVTSGGVILNPWQCLDEQKVQQLIDEASGIGRVTSGLSELDPRLWKP